MVNLKSKAKRHRKRPWPKRAASELRADRARRPRLRCELRTVPGSLNVLPWEAPEACAEAISAFVSSGTTLITQGTPPK